MKRIAIYSRKSKETDKGESIKNQIQMCKDYFNKKYEECSFETFEDEGFSGGNTNRPEFQKMLLLAQHNKFDIVAVYKIDRIARNIIDFMNTFDILQKNEVSLVSITEGFDPSTPAGMMMMTMMAGFAEMERMNIAQRIKDNMVELAKLGRWTGGTPPTGYRSIEINNAEKINVYLELIPEWIDKLQFIFNNIADGYTTFYVSKLLNMPPNTIHGIIQNPVYCKSDELSRIYLEKLGYKIYGAINGNGYLPYNRRPRKKNGKKEYNSNEMFVSVSIHEGVVDSETWIKANDQIYSRGKDSRPRISEKTFLAHLVKCKCGSGMHVDVSSHVKKDGTRLTYFCCSRRKHDKKSCDTNRINIPRLESDVLELLNSFSSNTSILQKYINKLSSSGTVDLDNEINKLKKSILKDKKTLNSLTEKLILLNDSASKIIAERMNDLSIKIDRNNEKLYLLESRKLNSISSNYNISDFQAKLKELLNNWNSFSMQDKQITINKIIKEIKWVDGKDFKVILNI